MINVTTFPLLLFSLMLAVKPLLASPTMIRINYTNCATCHMSPQGRGILNQYGRGIDEAMSLRAGIHEPAQSPMRRFLSAYGRINHDIRLVSYVKHTQSKVTNNPTSYQRLAYLRLDYINSTRVTEKHRVSFTAGIDSSPKAATKAYYAPPDRTLNIATKGGDTYLVLTKALWEYRPKEGLEIAIGRDYLPTGVNISDHASFIRSRNRQGFTEVPTQLKLFWWTDKFQIMPFIFGPSGQEGAKYRQFGIGTLAERVLWNSSVVVGFSGLIANGPTVNRQLLGLYSRMGFGSWGIFLEHDITIRQLKTESKASFNQYATFVQPFWAPMEWFNLILTLEHLKVDSPYSENVYKLGSKIAMRLTSTYTLALVAQRQLGDISSNSYSIKMFLKR